MKLVARSTQPLNPDRQDFLGWTALHHAVDNSSLACAKALITLGHARHVIDDMLFAETHRGLRSKRSPASANATIN